MRKEVRYGLGIGALVLVFLVTFFVVRNHTENQNLASEQDAEGTLDGEPVDAGSPEANPVPQTPAVTPSSNAAVVLPPMAAIQPGNPGNGTDAFGPGSVRPSAVNPAQDWDRLLETGEYPGAQRTRAAAPSRSTPTYSPPRSTGSVLQPRSSASASVRTTDTIASPRPPMTARSPSGLSAATGRTYVVREGDTFSSIAKAHYGQARQYLKIEQANPGVDPGRLRAGQPIILPDLDPTSAGTSMASAAGPFNHDRDNRPINPRTEYRVDTGDSLYRISMRLYNSPRMVDAIYAANRDAIGPDPQKLRFGMILKLPQANASSR